MNPPVRLESPVAVRVEVNNPALVVRFLLPKSMSRKAPEYGINVEALTEVNGIPKYALVSPSV